MFRLCFDSSLKTLICQEVREQKDDYFLSYEWGRVWGPQKGFSKAEMFRGVAGYSYSYSEIFER